MVGHVCGTRKTGELDCWGYNGTGQIGDGTVTQRAQPVRVHHTESATTYGNADLTSLVVGTGVGQFHTTAIHANGVMSAWGTGTNGRLGTGRADEEHSPAPVSVYPVP